jgi:5-methylcytosine-specific restriction endonuclease McrA
MEISKYLSMVGALGGKTKTPAKRRASRKNLRKAIAARKRLSLDSNQLSHSDYLRRNTPRLSTRTLAIYQRTICILSGKRLTGELDKEHLIPIARAARWAMTLEEKHQIVNSVFNLFVAHRSCNNKRRTLALKTWWERHPRYWAKGQQALSNLLSRRKPKASDMDTVVFVLKEAHIYLDPEE